VNVWIRIADSDLYYLRARHYDPATGRFLSQDPWTGLASAPQTQHPNAYVTNNPVRFVDPSGMCPGCDFVSAMVSFLYEEYFPWLNWVQECNARLLAAAAVIGGLGLGLGLAGIVTYQYFLAQAAAASTTAAGLDAVAILLSPSLAFAPFAGSGLLVVVASETALAACGDEGLFAGIPTVPGPNGGSHSEGSPKE